eukprot:comp20364_c0_seq1/m.25723 comp20364_c0_seq1/g.25723  ORF comp20364_c0_seq1/g.25723 comp20364_c0_seq1/m.25723 type:complete len:298 (-) comp20364_c0_seq1:322-1215(-)
MAPKEKKNIKEYLLAGGTAGMIARTAIAPIERVKILFQISKNTTQSGYISLLPSIMKKEGVLAFWKGNSAAVARVVPYMAITFLGYEEYKSSIVHHFPNMNRELTNLTAGALGGLTGVAITYPLDVVRARLAAQSFMAASERTYTGMVNALVEIPKREGFRALYQGMSATMMGVAPYAGLKFATYEAMKSVCCTVTGKEEKDLPAPIRFGSGAAAGVVAQTVVYPFDVIRRRTQTHTGAKPLYNSVLDAFRTIIREEGIRKGLYRGLTLNFLKTMPNVAIYMSVYDYLKIQLTRANI